MNTPRDEGWSGIDLNGTGISMYPAPTQKMMGDLAALLKTVRDGWHTSNGKIEGLEGKLGEGPLGEPVKEQYNPAVKQLRESINTMIDRFTKISDQGTKAVPLYVDADFQAGQHFEF